MSIDVKKTPNYRIWGLGDGRKEIKKDVILISLFRTSFLFCKSSALKTLAREVLLPLLSKVRSRPID